MPTPRNEYDGYGILTEVVPAMHPGTRTRLELLLEHYVRARRRTLRMLVGTTKEELDWRPGPGLPSATELLNTVATREENSIHRKARGKTSGQDGPALGDPRQYLVVLKRGTGRFVRGLLDGRERTKSASVLRDLEDLTEREIAATGQVDLLCRMRLAMAAGESLRPIPPGRAGQAVPARKSPARKASV